MDNRFNFPKKENYNFTMVYPIEPLQKRKREKSIQKVKYFPMVTNNTYEIVLVPNTEKVLLETKRPIKKKKVNKKRRYKRKLKLPMVIKESSYEIISIPNTEKILLETKRPYIPKRIYRLETHELISDLNADFYDELKEYFILEINKEYSRSVRRLLAPSAINLIPYIIHVRRTEYTHFLLKLFDADITSRSSLINFTFISVDENGEYDNKFIFERNDGELTIKINYD